MNGKMAKEVLKKKTTWSQYVRVSEACFASLIASG